MRIDVATIVVAIRMRDLKTCKHVAVLTNFMYLVVLPIVEGHQRNADEAPATNISFVSWDSAAVVVGPGLWSFHDAAQKLEPSNQG